MVAWSQLESEALYLGLGEFGNDFDAIKAKYQNELANRSVRSCHRKVARDTDATLRGKSNYRNCYRSRLGFTLLPRTMQRCNRFRIFSRVWQRDLLS